MFQNLFYQTLKARMDFNYIMLEFQCHSWKVLSEKRFSTHIKFTLSKNLFNRTQRSNIKIFISSFVPVTLTIISFHKRLSKTSWKKPVQDNERTSSLRLKNYKEKKNYQKKKKKKKKTWGKIKKQWKHIHMRKMKVRCQTIKRDTEDKKKLKPDWPTASSAMPNHASQN